MMQNGIPMPVNNQGGSEDNLFFIILIMAGVVYFALQVMGGVKDIQNKTFKKLSKEMQMTEFRNNKEASSEEGNDTSDLDEL